MELKFKYYLSTKKFIFLLCIIILPSISHAQSVGSTGATAVDSLRRQFEKDATQTVADFEEYSKKALEEYEKYEAQARADYSRYTRSIKQTWGSDTIVDNTPTKWVEYSNDYQNRSIVDFDQGKILVEVALDDNNTMDSNAINTRLATAIEHLLKSQGSTCPYQSSVDVSKPLTNNPVLDGLVDFSMYKPDKTLSSTGKEITPVRAAPPTPTVKGQKLSLNTNQKKESSGDTVSTGTTMARRVQEEGNKNSGNPLADKREEAHKRAEQKTQGWQNEAEKAILVKTIAAQSPKKITKVKGDDGKVRQVVQIEMNLVSDNLSKNATLYKDLVAEFSQVFQIEQPLIFAVMEQESRFNPEATSWVPAYGLMQLVPKSGGLDAYNYVYRNTWAPTRSYLFVPRNNIELGTAYLRVLMNQFSSVTDPHCRRLCVIASYNTGAGNVSRAFTGATNLNKAIPLINKYNYEQLYSHLTNRLSTSEARNYVSGVSKRREKYLKP